MRDRLEAVLREATVVTVALGIALGWALFQVAEGVAEFFTTLLTDYPDGSVVSDFTSGVPLSWEVGGRVLTLWPVIVGLIELGVVAIIAALVLRPRSVSRP